MAFVPILLNNSYILAHGWVALCITHGSSSKGSCMSGCVKCKTFPIPSLYSFTFSDSWFVTVFSCFIYVLLDSRNSSKTVGCVQDLTFILVTLLPVVSMNNEIKDQTDFSVGLKVLLSVSFVGFVWYISVITSVALHFYCKVSSSFLSNPHLLISWMWWCMFLLSKGL